MSNAPTVPPVVQDVESVPITLHHAQVIAHRVNLLQQHLGVRSSQEFATDDHHGVLRSLDSFAGGVLADQISSTVAVVSPQVFGRVGQVGVRADACDGGAAGDDSATKSTLRTGASVRGLVPMRST